MGRNPAWCKAVVPKCLSIAWECRNDGSKSGERLVDDGSLVYITLVVCCFIQ